MVLPLLQLLTALTGASISNIKMSIYLNNQGLKKIKAVSANINNQLKTIKAVYTNVNGTIHKIWPYYAFDNGTFKGELAGGVITNVYSGAHDYVYMNDKVAVPGGGSGSYSTPTPITSGGLYRNVNNPHGPQYPENTFGHPFGFISAAKIDFTKCSKIRITGSVNYTFYSMAGFANAVYWCIYPTIEQVYRYSATEQPGRYVRRNSVEGDGFAWWYGVKINDGEVGHSGDLPFDVTFDVSSWTTTTDQIAFYFEPNSGLSLSNEWTREIMNFKLNTIEFQP